MRWLLILLLFPICLQAQDFDHWFLPTTLRIDYFRTGDASEQVLSLDEMYHEKDWAGTRTRLVDEFHYGEYRIEVFDKKGEKLLYAQGYSSLFMEWQTTAEAKVLQRSFRESVRIPFPKEEIQVHFLLRSGDTWEMNWQLNIDPEDPDISMERRFPLRSVDISIGGNMDTCLDIAVVAEGYTAGEMKKFLEDAKRFSDYLFANKPYDQHKNHINIRAVLSPSSESGTDLPHNGSWKRTAVNSRFYTFGSERYLTTDDYHSLMHIASNVPWDQVLILVNTDKYGGGGIYNHYLLCTSDHPMSDFVFIHELGHSFAGLGDEYYESGTAYEEFYNLSAEPWEPNLTTLVDFDRKWKDVIMEGTPVPTPESDKFKSTIGVYEGAGYVAKGVYRPYIDCTMKSISRDNFCPVCLRAIRRMLDYYTGH